LKEFKAFAVKFSLGGNLGLNIFASGYPKSEAMSCVNPTQLNGTDSTSTTGSSGLQYDAASDTYSYNWNTDKAWAGTCRQFVVKLANNSVYRANFTFTK
jgi:hypothetical protein